MAGFFGVSFGYGRDDTWSRDFETRVRVSGSRVGRFRSLVAKIDNQRGLVLVVVGSRGVDMYE